MQFIIIQCILIYYLLIGVLVVESYFEQCNYQIQLNIGEKIYVNSPYYPNKYPTGSSCRYLLIGPINYQITFKCHINIDKVDSTCSTEQFYFLEEGSSDLAGSEYFCGNGNITRQSLYNQAAIAYTSSTNYNNNAGGYFSCFIEIQEKSCNCGWSRELKIAGGTQASINEFPSMAALVHNEFNRLICGATIIHHRYLLTAAHCLIHPNTSHLRIIVGYDGDIMKIDKNTTSDLIYNIEKLIMHRKFNTKTLKNDIALIQTTRDMQWSNLVGPVCLPYTMVSQNLAGLQIQAAGWGTLSYGGELPTNLQKTQLNVISRRSCQMQIPPPIIQLTNGQICTYQSNQDTCQFDSGGGHYYYNPNDHRKYLIGLTSYGFGCATTSPSINTKITSYLSWIQQNTPNIQYCRPSSQRSDFFNV